MARPFWFRLFGPNGPTTIGELRSALLNVTLGQGVGDGHFLERIRAVMDFPAGLPDPPGPRDPDQVASGGLRDQALLAAAVVLEHDLAAAPAPDLDSAARPSPAEGAVNLAGDDTGRTSSLYLGGIVSDHSLAGRPHSPFARLDLSAAYMLLGDLQTGLVIDPHNKTLLQGGPGDYPQLGAGPNDTVELDGDYSAGFGLGTPDFVEQVIVRAGNDYNLIADDSNVAAGGTLIVNAMPLGDSNHMLFDGSAESDGRFVFFGSEAGDVFLGGGGNDLIYGLGGADVLSGGGGSDIFAYNDAAQSSGADYDIIADFNPVADRIDLDVTVTGFDAAVQSGSLSAGSFNADLGATLAGLGAGHAVLYAPDSGDLAGNVFLIVDANGIAGYQEGEDYVFALAGTTLTDLTGHPGFLI